MLNPVMADKMRAQAGARRSEQREPGDPLVLHVDMDAFFAAVEERDNPELHGKPVIVGGEKNTRGVVTTANYVARNYGIHAGMSLFEAGKRCPHGIYLRSRGGKYSWTSLQLMELLRQFSPKVEPYSVDEAFLSATGCVQLWGGMYEYGKAVQDTIWEKLHLTASVGIGPSKTIAKIASGMNKPNGLTIIMQKDIMKVLGDSPVSIIPGVGKSTEKALNSLGIYTFAQLAKTPQYILRARLGIAGPSLSKITKGNSGNRVVTMEERPDDKSMGHEHTFMENVTCERTLLARLLHLCDKAARRMRREKYVGNVVTLKLRFADFSTFSHQTHLLEFSDDPHVIYTTAVKLLRDLWHENHKAVRLIGVSISNLFIPGSERGVQENLFDSDILARKRVLFAAMDSVRNHYGEDVLAFAGGMECRRRGRRDGIKDIVDG
ncbi:DNA polymerase IV [bacterium]|nr:DNA polymerase IV [bacterium]